MAAMFCDIPPPSEKECLEIPLCGANDFPNVTAVQSICSAGLSVTSCLGGFMYVDPNNITAKPPKSYNELPIPTKNATECYEYNPSYVYTRACCPGYYCPPSMYCMMKCDHTGSYCPSSDTAIYPDCSTAYIHDATTEATIQYHSLMGCGGSYLYDTICPNGSYCTNSSIKEECPEGYFCRAGSTSPEPCSLLQLCPAGNQYPSNSVLASALFVIILIVVLGLIFIEKIEQYGMKCFGWCYKKRTGKDWEAARVAKNKAKKHDLNTIFTKSNSKNNVNDDSFRPYKTEDLKNYNAKLKHNVSGANVFNMGDNSDIEYVEMINDGIDEEKDVYIDAANQTLGGNVEQKVEPRDPNDSMTSNISLDKKVSAKLDFFMDLEFKNLSLHLKSNNKTILDNCSGYIHCGTVNAIMGPSGAGKTSFLYTLCGKARAYGNISGDLLINGEKKTVQDFKDIVGFVPQSDTMTAEMTVKEMLEFNARFRLSADVSQDYRKSVVRDVLKLLKIDRIRHSNIGDDVKRGISGGQQKRVNIGMELVSQPSLLFLDEPTSGLDSTTSNDVMEVLKLIAKRGTTVLVVLHQPRYEIFQAFDNVILLAEGGKMVYMGDTSKAVPYFGQFGYQKPDLVNPADFLMDIISGEVKCDDPKNYDNGGQPDLPQKWIDQDKKLYPMKINPDFFFMDHLIKDNSKYKRRKKLSCINQTWMCTKRAVTVIWRQKATLVSDIVMIAFTGYVLGYIIDSATIKKLPSNVFFTIMSSSIVGCIVSLRIFGNDRIMYWRFASSGINRLSYYIGAVIATAPWIIFEPCLFIMFYWPMAKPRGPILVYWELLVIGMFCVQGLGNLISIIVDPNKAILVSVVLVMIMNFFNGFEPPLNGLGGGGKFVTNIAYSRWQQEALWQHEINSWPQVFAAIREAQHQYYGWNLDQQSFDKDIMIMVIIGFIFRFLTFVALRFVNRAKQM